MTKMCFQKKILFYDKLHYHLDKKSGYDKSYLY